MACVTINQKEESLRRVYGCSAVTVKCVRPRTLNFRETHLEAVKRRGYDVVIGVNEEKCVEKIEAGTCVLHRR